MIGSKAQKEGNVAVGTVGMLVEAMSNVQSAVRLLIALEGRECLWRQGEIGLDKLESGDWPLVM